MPHWNTANAKYYNELKTEVKRLKAEMTFAETLLWKELQSKKVGVKFRRQHMIDKFIPDFVSLPIKLIIEVDGGIHKLQKNYDEYRTLELELLGYKVIRFTNEEVFTNVAGVVSRIKEVICNLTPPNLPKGEALPCSNIELDETKSELRHTMPSHPLGDLGGQMY